MHSGHRHRQKMVILLKNIWHRGGREFSEALGQNGNMRPLAVGQAESTGPGKQCWKILTAVPSRVISH